MLPLAVVLCRQPGREQVGYAEFNDKVSAVKARNLYQGYGGYGGRGFQITVVTSDYAASPQNPQMQLSGGGGAQKRLRDGDGGCSACAAVCLLPMLSAAPDIC